MSVDKTGRELADRQPRTAGSEFVRRFENALHELRQQPGTYYKTTQLLSEFADLHPNLRGSYISREVDPSYFANGQCGWEAGARGKLQALALEGECLFEFLAFTNGIRMHSTPLSSVMNVEETWLEPSTDQPFVFKACMYHSFPATTLLTACTPEGEESAHEFLARVKYLRGF